MKQIATDTANLVATCSVSAMRGGVIGVLCILTRYTSHWELAVLALSFLCLVAGLVCLVATFACSAHYALEAHDLERARYVGSPVEDVPQDVVNVWDSCTCDASHQDECLCYLGEESIDDAAMNYVEFDKLTRALALAPTTYALFADGIPVGGKVAE